MLAILAALTPAVFALVTNDIWEDFFITYRCSLNLAQGHGLVYEVGRRIHVFTSPLGVLVPAGIRWVFHTADPQFVINVFRLCACLSLGLAWWLMAGRITGTVALAMVSGLWLLDAKMAAYSINGMETAFLVLFVILAWRAVVDGNMRWAGFAFGGLMWTRPDGFVYIGALAAATWILQKERRSDWAGWARMIVFGLCIYAPWFIWAWWYYGSPVPHTILAKQTILPESTLLSALTTWPFRLFLGRTASDDAFMPSYFYFGGWPSALWVWSKIMTLGALGAVCCSRCARPTRIAGLAFVLGGLYLEITPRAPWYFPAWAILAYIAIAGLVATLAESLRERRRMGTVIVSTIAIIVVLPQGAIYLGASVQLREQQSVIEWGLRSNIGRDLRRMAAGPRDTVFLEPLGYIGFFSGLAMRDTPGLCAPEVVALRKSGRMTMGSIAVALKTDWVVLRRNEFKAMTGPELAQFEMMYEYRGDYDARPQVEAAGFLPGRNFLRYDAHFLLWHIKKEQSSRSTAH
jgi:hypothetical protein